MNTVMLLVATATLGIDVGWEPVPSGQGVEYIIQVQPELLETLQAGKDLVSELPAGLEVRQYRITVGKAKLPRQPSLAELHQTVQQEALAQQDRKRKEDEALQQQEDERAQLVRDRDQLARDSQQLAADRAELLKDRDQLAKVRAAVGAAKSDASATPRQASESPEREPGAVDELTDEASSAASGFGEGQRRPRAPKELKVPDGNLMGGLQTGFDEPPEDQRTTKKPVNAAAAPAKPAAHPSETAKPWVPLLLAVVLLFISLSGNLYLGWVAWGERTRSRGLLEKLHAAAGGA